MVENKYQTDLGGTRSLNAWLIHGMEQILADCFIPDDDFQQHCFAFGVGAITPHSGADAYLFTATPVWGEL